MSAPARRFQFGADNVRFVPFVKLQEPRLIQLLNILPVVGVITR